MHNELKIFGCNYRHYNLHDERWIGKDKISENLIANNYVFINNEPKSDINILGLYSWGDFGIDLLSAALVVGDVILGGPTGEGIGPAIALQGMKTGAKIATKEAAKKVAVKDAKEKVKKTAECLAIYDGYKAADKNAAGCKACLKCPDYLKLLAARAAEITGCSLYFKKKCDYILPDSITKGSAAAVSSHKNELTNKIKAFSKCAKHAVKAGCNNLPPLPQI
ncbi:hypothetical protein J5W75_01205 [Akkermansia muciniphila]|uniref:hypothetical protein n=1 Tax=Akkermansia muciniphila TaxID=239935 RepID=UPI001C060F1E|nr:hypothetical protein [Akkermansia muciniphila]QWP08042.1 hypothetical protein J5W75_01205 [Akkermansia muciniphila]